MKKNNEYTLLDFQFADGKKKLKLVLTYFNDIPKIDIREYYWDAGEDEFKHSKKGVQLDAQKAGALRAALEENEKIIDNHLLSDGLENWASKITLIETSADFFSNFEFYKTVSRGDKEEVIFNSNHPFSRKVLELDKVIDKEGPAAELMTLLKCVLLSYHHSLSQFDERAKVTVGDFTLDQGQTWSTLLKRLTSTT